MDTAELSYFFRPRVGKNYDDGFRGLKTFVVGAYHYCWESDAMKYGCTYRQACIGERHTRKFDKLCPIYRDRMKQHKGYYRISILYFEWHSTCACHDFFLDMCIADPRSAAYS